MAELCRSERSGMIREGGVARPAENSLVLALLWGVDVDGPVFGSALLC